MTKTVYQTDRAGHFVGETEADESPLEPGVYHLPAGAVEKSPPKKWPDDKWPRWNGKKWELITKPDVAKQPSAMEKLQQFLKDNPDVIDVINSNPGGV